MEKLKEPVWVAGGFDPGLDPKKRTLRYHPDPFCSMPRNHDYVAIELEDAVAMGFTPCRKAGPCHDSTPSRRRWYGRNRQMVTGGVSDTNPVYDERGIKVPLAKREER